MRSIGICPYITLYPAIVNVVNVVDIDNIDNGYFLFPFLQIESDILAKTRQCKFDTTIVDNSNIHFGILYAKVLSDLF